MFWVTEQCATTNRVCAWFYRKRGPAARQLAALRTRPALALTLSARSAAASILSGNKTTNRSVLGSTRKIINVYTKQVRLCYANRNSAIRATRLLS